VRYEGILEAVDLVSKSMTLANVHSCGTEGRRNGENEIQATPENVIDEVIFRVDHIKDFKIIEKPPAPVVSMVTPQVDPAIISSGRI
jgi:protein LSM14